MSRTSRTSALTEPRAGTAVSYLSKRTPARVPALVDVRQNLRPVKKDTDVYQGKSSGSAGSSRNAASFLSPVSQRTSKFAQYFSPPPTFTSGGTPQTPSSVRSPTTMAITNARNPSVQNRVIPKSERPWRQRLADNARIRNSHLDGLTSPIEDSSSRLLAARSCRRPSIGSSSHATSSLHSPPKDTPEQQLHHQLAALRNIVTEDKNKVRTADGALITPRGMSTFSTIGSMPSTVRFRSSGMHGGSSSYHPSLTVSTNSNFPHVMSRSYSPIRSSNGFLSSADSTASAALLRYEQSKEKRPDPAPKVTAIITPDKAPLAMSESITDVRLDTNQTAPAEVEQKTGERRRRSKSSRRQKSSLVSAQSSNSSSETEEKQQRPRPARKSSKEPKKGVDELKEAKPSEKTSNNIASADTTLGPNTAKMVAADNTTTPKAILSRTPSGEAKKKPVTPLAKRKKKAVDAEVKKEADVIIAAHLPVNKPVEPAPTAKPVEEDDESKYNAVAKFKPASSLPKPIATRVKKPVPVVVEAPVPGSWDLENERYISQNKHLIRKPVTTKVEVVCKELQLEKLPVKSIRMLPVVKRKALLSKQLQLNSSLTSNKSEDERKQNAAIVLKPKSEPKALKIIKSIAKPKKLATALAIVNKEFTNKKRLRLGIEKVMRLRGLKTDSQHLKCHQPKNATAAMILTILFREQQRAASVTILSTAITDVNWSRIENYFKITTPIQAKKTKERDAVASILNKENLAVQPGVVIKKVPTIGPPLISSQRPLGKRVEGKGPAFIKNSHIPCSTTYTAGAPIVLPDKSLLEEYVQRKRNELENLHTSDEFLSTESSRRDSPNLIFPAEQPSKLVQVVVKEPAATRPAGKTKAAEGTNPAIASANAQMVQISPYNNAADNRAGKAPTARNMGAPLANNNQATAPNFMLRRQLKKPQELVQPANVFDTPKSLFEERMQNQAHQLKRTSQPTSFPVYEPEDQMGINPETPVDLAPMAGLRRRSSGEKPSNVAHNFSVAMDQLQKQHSTERYAAHIPLSGRQSTTSVDSSNSGALDTASRQLDQMIDQARYRHHQHARSKFKEAIDYLDHIFEDLRNECDKDGYPYKDNEKIEARPEIIAPAPVKSAGNRIQAAKAAFQKQQSGSEESANRNPVPKTNAESNWPKNVNEKTTATKVLNKPSGIASRQPAQPQNQQLKQNVSLKTGQRKSFSNNGDVEVSETVLLPSKNTSDRLDFTRKWLVDDIKSWADLPSKKPDLIVGSVEQTDFEENNESDEHSLGSCSAEVAAINASEKQKKKVRDAPADIVKPAKTQTLNKKTAPVKAIPQPKMVNTVEQAPIRPQPYRPQPQFAIYPPNGNVTDSIYELQKVPSQEQLRMRYSQERAASQDYQSLGSTHSQEGLKPTSSAFLSTNSLHRGGAFVNYPQRGSIQSLPDAALLTVNQPPPMRVGRVAPNDHALAIDLLVAELELNTDAPSVSDKRRSFPTTQGEVSIGSARRDSNQQANQSKLGVAKISVQRSSNSPAKMPQMGQSSTLGRGASLQQDKRSQKNSLDEMAEMLRDVAGDLHPKHSIQSQSRLQQPQQPQPALSPRKYSNPRANLGVGLAAEKSAANPFETINQERLNPSRVEAIQHMFEKSGNSNGVSSWSKKLTKNTEPVEYIPVPEKSKLRTVNIAPIFRQQATSPSIANPSETTGPVKLRLKPVEKTVPFSSAQPPLVPASIVNSKPGSSGNKQPANSANSSQNSGYYSASSLAGGVGQQLNHQNNNNPASTGQSSSTLRRSRGDSVFNGKNNNSTSSRAPSIDVDDDGFYDNILTENRFSGVISEMDDTSLCSQNLPPSQKSAGARIGQLIRRIGGSSLSKPPVQSAASLVSLNKVANDTPMHPRPHAGLMKSNSLSNEPWRIHAMGKEASSAAESKSMGIGDRLKQSIFGGSKKRLQT